ncbi:MAG: D-glycerate dehydrogenase [Halanaerobiales bacterium]|nr:D-glycerate dehydrogenase [Halanaerobiales bacterium]
MKKIFITRKIPDLGMNLLKDKFEIKVYSNQDDPTKNQIIKMGKDADAIIPLLSHDIDREVIESCNRLKIIANYAVGYDNIDIKAAKDNNVYVTNTPDVLTEATSELTWALILAVSRRVVESDKFVRQLKFKGWGPELLLGHEIHGKTLGIIGFGRIGKSVARIAQGFKMDVLYTKRAALDKTEEKKLNVKYSDINNLLKKSDFITVNASLNDSTYHLIGKKEFDIMKDTAVLVNTGRGSIINEAELVTALKNKKIYGAGLDVYENEPEVSKGLLDLDNVILTPHTGSATIKARNKMAEIAAKNVIEVLKGNQPINKVI